MSVDLQSKLSGENAIEFISTWAVATIKYAMGVINWVIEELEYIDRKTGKLSNKHGEFKPRSKVDPVCITRFGWNRPKTC